ncbi:hypothetical protein BDZ89DRAFT_1046841 [Hymenopellis radicata]|nr:hypothetical protein BDZ89DRAFT_1046841 [Hymenopellis radicata]
MEVLALAHESIALLEEIASDAFAVSGKHNAEDQIIDEQLTVHEHNAYKRFTNKIIIHNALPSPRASDFKDAYLGYPPYLASEPLEDLAFKRLMSTYTDTASNWDHELQELVHKITLFSGVVPHRFEVISNEDQAAALVDIVKNMEQHDTNALSNPWVAYVLNSVQIVLYMTVLTGEHASEQWLERMVRKLFIRSHRDIFDNYKEHSEDPVVQATTLAAFHKFAIEHNEEFERRERFYALYLSFGPAVFLDRFFDPSSTTRGGPFHTDAYLELVHLVITNDTDMNERRRESNLCRSADSLHRALTALAGVQVAEHVTNFLTAHPPFIPPTYKYGWGRMTSEEYGHSKTMDMSSVLPANDNELKLKLQDITFVRNVQVDTRELVSMALDLVVRHKDQPIRRPALPPESRNTPALQRSSYLAPFAPTAPHGAAAASSSSSLGVYSSAIARYWPSSIAALRLAQWSHTPMVRPVLRKVERPTPHHLAPSAIAARAPTATPRLGIVADMPTVVEPMSSPSKKELASLTAESATLLKEIERQFSFNNRKLAASSKEQRQGDESQDLDHEAPEEGDMADPQIAAVMSDAVKRFNNKILPYAGQRSLPASQFNIDIQEYPKALGNAALEDLAFTTLMRTYLDKPEKWKKRLDELVAQQAPFVGLAKQRYEIEPDEDVEDAIVEISRNIEKHNLNTASNAWVAHVLTSVQVLLYTIAWTSKKGKGSTKWKDAILNKLFNRAHPDFIANLKTNPGDAAVESERKAAFKTFKNQHDKELQSRKLFLTLYRRFGPGVFLDRYFDPCFKTRGGPVHTKAYAELVHLAVEDETHTVVADEAEYSRTEWNLSWSADTLHRALSALAGLEVANSVSNFMTAHPPIVPEGYEYGWGRMVSVEEQQAMDQEAMDQDV